DPEKDRDINAEADSLGLGPGRSPRHHIDTRPESALRNPWKNRGNSGRLPSDREPRLHRSRPRPKVAREHPIPIRTTHAWTPFSAATSSIGFTTTTVWNGASPARRPIQTRRQPVERTGRRRRKPPRPCRSPNGPMAAPPRSG